MGQAKHAWTGAQEQGWSAPDDKFVCADCVEDAYLKSVIDANLRDTTCSYCDRTNAVDIAAPVEALIQSIASTVGCYFNVSGQSTPPLQRSTACDDRRAAAVISSR
jgi:hypothetical protein